MKAVRVYKVGGPALEDPGLVPAGATGLPVAHKIGLEQVAHLDEEGLGRIIDSAQARALRERLKNFSGMPRTDLPAALQADLRPYQKDGFDFLCHLSQLGLGGILAQIAQAYGMDFVSTQRIYNTRLAHEATEYAREHGQAIQFHRIVFRQVYAEGLDISRWDTLRTAAQEAGLDGEDMQQVVESGKYTAHVAAQVEEAYQIGVSGVPTYVINDRYAIVGAQPYEAFQRALAQILS